MPSILKNGVVIATSNYLPNADDLGNRDETAIQATGEVGQLWDGQAFSDPAPVPKTLDVIKSDKMQEMLAACEAQIRSGFVSSALGEAHLYDTAKDIDQLNLIAAGISGNDIPFTCTRVSDGVKAQRFHTAAQITQVYAEAAAEKVRLLGVMDSKRTEIAAASTIEDALSITWTG